MADPQQQQLTNQQFAAKIRAKYPGSYDSLSDDDLTNRIVTKYPSYKSVLAPAQKAEDAGLDYSTKTPEAQRSFIQRLISPENIARSSTPPADAPWYSPDRFAAAAVRNVTAPVSLLRGPTTLEEAKTTQQAGRHGYESLVGNRILQMAMGVAGKIGDPEAPPATTNIPPNPTGASVIDPLYDAVMGAQLGMATGEVPSAVRSAATATKGAARPILKTIAGTGKALATAADPDLVGLISPRLAHAQRLARKVGKVADNLADKIPTANAAAETPMAESAQGAVEPVTGPSKYAHKEVDEPTTPVSRPVNEVRPTEDIPAVQTHELPVPNAQPVTPASMEGFYGKTKQKSNLKANQRQLASPTASTAPGQTAAPTSGLPRNILDIMTKPGLSDADLKVLQDFNSGMKPAEPGMAGFKNYSQPSTIRQITGGGKAASAKASQGAAAPMSPLLQDAFKAIKEADARVAAEPNTYVRSVTQRPGFGTAKVPVEEQMPKPKIKVRRKQVGR